MLFKKLAHTSYLHYNAMQMCTKTV